MSLPPPSHTRLCAIHHYFTSPHHTHVVADSMFFISGFCMIGNTRMLPAWCCTKENVNVYILLICLSLRHWKVLPWFLGLWADFLYMSTVSAILTSLDFSRLPLQLLQYLQYLFIFLQCFFIFIHDFLLRFFIIWLTFLTYLL